MKTKKAIYVKCLEEWLVHNKHSMKVPIIIILLLVILKIINILLTFFMV